MGYKLITLKQLINGPYNCSIKILTQLIITTGEKHAALIDGIKKYVGVEKTKAKTKTKEAKTTMKAKVDRRRGRRSGVLNIDPADIPDLLKNVDLNNINNNNNNHVLRCPFCPKTSANSSLLRTHVAQVHFSDALEVFMPADGGLECDLCETVSVSKANLLIHVANK